MNVAHQFQKVSVPVAEDRFVSSLKEVANGAGTAGYSIELYVN